MEEEICRIGPTTATKLVNRAHEGVRSNPSQRFGQVLFNLVMQDHPNLATFYTGTGADFFYEQSRVVVISMFYQHWVEEE